eukprot:1026382-Rhodomonas_salina.1
MGNQMKKGESYVDAFAPVPRSTAGRVMMSVAAALNLEMHACNLSQAFIQASWDDLPEKQSQLFIRPPSGWDEEAGVVYEVLRPLYGVPSSARSLHFTLDKFMRENKFQKSGFEESVWIRYADDELPHTIMSLDTLSKFKARFLERFEGTDEGEVTEYLGCDIVRDREQGTLTIRQTAYIRKCIAVHGMTNANPVKTPMEPGVRLSKRDCPKVVDAAIQEEYRAIVGHVSFMVQMTRPDLAFAFAELSKFVAAPGVVHLKAARRVLAYLVGTADRGITYSRPEDSAMVNKLMGWVDSDYAADPDTRKSVTGYIVSMNNGPISWKSKRQSCVTLSSAEAEFVAASVCCQEIVYLRNLLRDLDMVQEGPT